MKTAPSLLEFQLQVIQLAQVNQEDRIHPGKQSTIAQLCKDTEKIWDSSHASWTYACPMHVDLTPLEVSEAGDLAFNLAYMH